MNVKLTLHGEQSPKITLPTVVKCLVILGTMGFLSIGPAFAQNAELQEKVAAAKQAAAENQQKLRQYQWIETTQLTIKGNQKPPRQYSCQYGPDGQVEKTPMVPTEEQTSGGRIKRRIIEKKKAEMKDYMQDVKAVLAMYVPPDPQRMQQAYQSGNVALSPAPGSVNLVFTNYAQPNDKMILTFDTATRKISTLNIDTYMGEAKDKVTLQVQMASLPDGTNYPAQTILNAAAKELTVTTMNSSYRKL